MLQDHPGLRLIGLDRDREAIAIASERLAPFADRLTIVHAVYDEIPTVLSGLGIAGVDGILFDLGVSSMQLDEADRGFAYNKDAQLDMRMDASRGISAADVVNTYSAADLARIIARYGEAIGLAFQVVDDILDVTADSAVLGKTAGKDAAADKPTYVALMGLQAAQRHADELAQEALQALTDTGLPEPALQALRGLAAMVVRRQH